MRKEWDIDLPTSYRHIRVTKPVYISDPAGERGRVFHIVDDEGSVHEPEEYWFSPAERTLLLNGDGPKLIRLRCETRVVSASVEPCRQLALFGPAEVGL